VLALLAVRSKTGKELVSSSFFVLFFSEDSSIVSLRQIKAKSKRRARRGARK